MATNPTTATPRERNFYVLLRNETKVNAPWLEKQAIQLEERLLSECDDTISGPSVSANFAENGFELDFTVLASSLSEAYDKLGTVLSIIEDAAGITIADSSDEIRSDYESVPPQHDPQLVGAT
jgi:hypothetical protein